MNSPINEPSFFQLFVGCIARHYLDRGTVPEKSEADNVNEAIGFVASYFTLVLCLAGSAMVLAAKRFEVFPFEGAERIQLAALIIVVLSFLSFFFFFASKDRGRRSLVAYDSLKETQKTAFFIAYILLVLASFAWASFEIVVS